ncbi:ATP-binding protein [Dactylosporangium darangshiense]|uniref:HTH luxR-type domain-containing protein n=1 Tax=Dactylosporangium darangshiense TaxID=579108 RepID=A0ABP8DLB4_9ACTN
MDPVVTAQAGISTREAEVLTLLGEHLSNAEIGARLYISVRTVETHVSSLLRKLGAPDRRALAQLATEWSRAARGGRAASGLPSPVTRFVGRARERADLAGAIRAHRQVSAVGPGGVGKTRLALAVAGDVAGDFADGVWFVDLVPITDSAMVGAAVAAAVGIGEQQGRGLDESVVAALADRHALLVLDNCEHLRDGVAPFLERLLTGCPRLTVLATSRARLMVPFERVHPVPPLSLDGDDDAVALFLERAAAVGWPITPEQRDQVAEICARLDGVALAIELAAARLPLLGLDGLAAGDQLRLLTGGARADDRHRSVRAMLDWSYALLDEDDRTLLRRIAVFVAPFTADAAGRVAAFAPLEPGAVFDGLARLAEQSLLTATPATGGMRYRTLATIRQYGTEQLTGAGELDDVRARHLRWCVASATDLAGQVRPADGPWRIRFDAVADDLRAALGRAAADPGHRGDAHRLAVALAEAAFTRNLAGEAQQRYEQAAALAEDDADTAEALRRAAAVAGCRLLGDDMYRLHRAAADAAARAGDKTGAARQLSTAATTAYRFSGAFTQVPPPDEPEALLREARALAGRDPATEAAVVLAEAAVLADAFGSDQGPSDNAVAETLAAATRAVDLARRANDPLAVSAALDSLAGAQSWAGDSFGAAATARGRIELLSAVSVQPASMHELTDALVSGVDTSLGVGDLHTARRWSRQLADLPLLAEVGHYALSWRLMVDVLAGEAHDVLAASDRFLEAWERTGRLRAPRLAATAAAVAMLHGLRGDDGARAQWLGIADRLGATPERSVGYGAVFDATVHLHHGRPEAALQCVAAEPAQVWKWVTWIWLHWYVALGAEAAALAGHSDARARIAAARATVGANPIAAAQLDRAEALLDGDRARLLATADAFEAAGAPYQRARTLLLAGGDEAAIGAAAMTGGGIDPGAPLPTL